MRSIVIAATILLASAASSEVDLSEPLYNIARQRANLLGEMSSCDRQDRQEEATSVAWGIAELRGEEESSTFKILTNEYSLGRLTPCNTLGKSIYPRLIATADSELKKHLPIKPEKPKGFWGLFKKE